MNATLRRQRDYDVGTAGGATGGSRPWT